MRIGQVHDGKLHYSDEDICHLLREAERLGLDLKSKELHDITLEQLEKLVTVKQ
jgi:hypothetical protein